jgi:membrane-bound serine protease (ClpP class)
VARIYLYFVFLLQFLTFSLNSAANSRAIEVVKINQPITIATLETLSRILEKAETTQAEAVLVEIDTPGGYLEATREIVKLFLNTEKTRIIVWVTPEGSRAASAGSMITMAAHFAAMAPNTSIGAATPISGDGKEIPKSLQAKVENDTISFVKGIAHKRNRNQDWAVKSVTDAASLTAEEALQNNVVDSVAPTREELIRQYKLKFKISDSQTFEFVENQLTLREETLGFFSNPNISYGLFALGALGIYLELTHPGTFIPGTLGAISLALGAITMKIIPIRPGAIILLLIGFILLAIEFLTPIPTLGVAGVGGVVSLILSAVFLMDSAQSDLSLSPSLWVPIGSTIVAFGVWIGYLTSRSLRISKKDQHTQALVGESGVVESSISENLYWIRVHGELWKAKNLNEKSPLNKNDKVQVKNQSGFSLEVTKIES